MLTVGQVTFSSNCRGRVLTTH